MSALVVAFVCFGCAALGAAWRWVRRHPSTEEPWEPESWTSDPGEVWAVDDDLNETFLGQGNFLVGYDGDGDLVYFSDIIDENIDWSDVIQARWGVKAVMPPHDSYGAPIYAPQTTWVNEDGEVRF